MGQEQQIDFGPFRLDPVKKQLWRGKQEVELQPRPLAVLHYLAARPGQVVTKEELLKQVWAGTYVTKTALKVCVRAIRKALGDDTNNPQYLETVGWEGYRFLERVVSHQSSVISSDKTKNPQLATGNWQPITHLVGRKVELSQLHRWLAKALSGERQVVFVTGEPGIGKTTLVDTFLSILREGELGIGEQKRQKAKNKEQKAKVKTGDLRLETRPASPQTSSLNPQVSNLWLGRGQCVEQYGGGEAYLPVLEALGRLCREPEGSTSSPCLRSMHRRGWCKCLR